MSAQRWEITIAPAAASQIAAITDVRVRRLITERIENLAEALEDQGKALSDDTASSTG